MWMCHTRCAKHLRAAVWVIASTKCWFNTCPIIDIHIAKRIVMYAMVVPENVTTRMLHRAVQIKWHLCVRYCQETKMSIMWPTVPQTQVAIKHYTTACTASAQNCASLGTHKNDINFYLRYYVIYVRWRSYVTIRMKTKISFDHTRGTQLFPII